MYPTVLFGFLLVTAGVLYLLRPESRFVAIVLCAASLTVGAGLLGTFTGFITTFRYIGHVPSPDQMKIAALGCAESLNNIVLALILVLIAGLPTLGGVWRSIRRAP